MYETISISEPIKDMISACPFLVDFNIAVIPMRFNDYTQEESIAGQAVIDINNARIFSQTAMIDGVQSTIMHKIVSFSFLQMTHPSDDDTIRFKENFPDWVDEQHINRKAPRFSYERRLDGSIAKFDWKDELIEAANPQYIGKDESGANVYSVDIHVIYIIKYQSKGRCW